MAFDNKVGADKGPLKLNAVPEKYVALGSLVDPTKPSNMDLLVKTFGDQGLTGFLELSGATKSIATADEVQWWEESRLHRTINATIATAVSTSAAGTFVITQVDGVAVGAGVATTNAASSFIRVNDVLLGSNGKRLLVTSVTDTTALSFTAKDLNAGGIAADATSPGAQYNVIGNLYAQGTAQPSKFYSTQLTKRVNPLFITKETFQVTGSAATNIGWVDVGGGDYRWFIKGEMDTRKRFLNQREAMLMWGQANNAIGVGTKGYFSEIEDRGIVVDGANAGFVEASGSQFADMDAIILAIDKEGAPSEYAMFVDLATSLAIDNMVANGVSTATAAGLAGQFGAFNNNPNMAVSLGFKSFTRGGYTFHKKDWKLLNDPTMGGFYTKGTGSVTGVLTPLSTVADAKTGERSPSLEMVYKSAGGYSRDIEHWVTGGGVLGYKTDDEDLAKFHYRSECALVTRAANQHVVLKA
jgi:hypothetical protein